MPELSVNSPPVSKTILPSASTRLMSIDALRGFDMFWIIGADALVYAFNRLSHGGAAPAAGVDQPWTLSGFIATQLEHVDWAGFHFYDMIFPLFVFIMGVSMVFSLTKQLETGGHAEALKRLIRRFVLLFVIAFLYSGGFNNLWPDIRLLGVLNRIALCYLFGGLVFIFCKPRVMAAVAAALLVGYWAMLNFVPIRDIRLENSALAAQAGDAKSAAQFREGKTIFGDGKNFSAVSNSPAWAAAEKMYFATTTKTTGKFEPGYNVANHFDFEHLPGKKYDVYWDPEGILSTIPAIATCLLGALAGLLLRSKNHCDKWKLIYLFSLGAAGVILGFTWGLQFPVIKKIWSSSFVLVAGGYSAMLLGLFYWMVDVKKWQWWCQPFVWMGMNSITVYVASNVIGGFRKLGGRFVGGDVKTFVDAHVANGAGDLLIAVVGLGLAFLFVRFLYQRKIFLRV